MRPLLLFVIVASLFFSNSYAQGEDPDEILLATTAPKGTWYDQDKKESIKERAMQVEFFLKQRDRDNYIFIIDGVVLATEDFEDYKSSILKQAKAINFVRSIDSVMGYPTQRKRMLILITTVTVND